MMLNEETMAEPKPTLAMVLESTNLNGANFHSATTATASARTEAHMML